MGLLIFFSSFVIPAGFEPTTHSLEGCCSIQLSYGTNSLKYPPPSHAVCQHLSGVSPPARKADYNILAVQNYTKYINPPNFSAILIYKNTIKLSSLQRGFKQGLALEGILWRYAVARPLLHIAVILRGECPQKCHATLGVVRMAEAAAVGIDGGGYEVDTQKCTARSTKAWGNGRSIAKKVTPALRDVSTKHLL